MSHNLSELSGRKGLTDNLFTRLGELAIKDGTPSVEELEKLAHEFLIGSANTYGAITFYDFLKPENRDKKIYVCNGTACLCAGSQESLIENLNHHFQADEIGHMTCLGRCHENHAFHFNGRNYSGPAIAEKLESIFSGNGINGDDKYRIKSSGTQILTSPFPGIEDYYKPLLTALEKKPEVLLEEIKTSGVRGRGGAGFPLGLKLEFCRNESSDIKFIICNADEGDPGAFSDRYLLELQPHSVLFGMLTAGYVTGAKHGVLYIRAEYPDSIAICKNAIDELREKGLMGKGIGGTNFDFDVKVISAKGSYICGEETALINSIEGQRPEVRIRPPYPAQQGLFNKPTIVNNVETLATLHYIISNGGAAWKAIGTSKSSGTKLICLDSFFKHPGLYEVEMGTPLKTVVDDLGGGFKRPVKALQIGGPLGGLVPVWKISDLTIDFESFAENGFLLGHASVVSIPEDFPILRFIEHLFEFAANESCGKCFPCRLGTKRGQDLAAKALESDYKIDKKLLTDLLTTLEEGSLCAHGGGIPLPIRNALQHFESELSVYLEDKL